MRFREKLIKIALRLFGSEEQFTFCLVVLAQQDKAQVQKKNLVTILSFYVEQRGMGRKTRTKKRMSIVRKVLKALLYVTLFGAGSFIFAWGSIKEYLEDKTYYLPEKRPITLSDLPTLVSCWSLYESQNYRRDVYGKDFTIDVKVYDDRDDRKISQRKF